MAEANSVKAADAALRDELEALRSELATLKDSMSSLGQSAARAARAGAHDARARVESAVGTARAKGREAAESLEAKVEENPLMAIGVAFGIGLVVGAVLRR